MLSHAVGWPRLFCGVYYCLYIYVYNIYIYYILYIYIYIIYILYIYILYIYIYYILYYIYIPGITPGIPTWDSSLVPRPNTSKVPVALVESHLGTPPCGTCSDISCTFISCAQGWKGANTALSVGTNMAGNFPQPNGGCRIESSMNGWFCNAVFDYRMVIYCISNNGVHTQKNAIYIKLVQHLNHEPSPFFTINDHKWVEQNPKIRSFLLTVNRNKTPLSDHVLLQKLWTKLIQRTHHDPKGRSPSIQEPPSNLSRSQAAQSIHNWSPKPYSQQWNKQTLHHLASQIAYGQHGSLAS